MDKRKTSGLSHDGRVSQAYLHERSILQKRLDQFQREQDKSIKKISNRQETLANAFAAETSKNQSMESSLMEINSPRRSRAGSISNLYSGNPENMEINPRLRKISVPSDMRYRKLSFASSETKSTRRAIRQISDPLQSSSQTSEDSKVAVTLPRRKLTTGQLNLAVPSKDCRPQSGGSESHIFKTTLSRNQSKLRANFLSAKLPSELGNLLYTPLSNSKSDPDNSLGKMNFQTRSASSSANTTTRMVNETSAEVKNKYIKDSLVNVSKKVLDNKRKTSHGSNSSFQELPDVSNDNIEPLENNVDKIIQATSPGALITNGQLQNTEICASDVYLCRESPIAKVQTPDHSQQGSNFNFNSGSKDETNSSESDKRVSRKVSLSGNKSTRHLHALTSSTQEAGATGGVGHLGNGWTDHNRTARRKISTVVAPLGIVINAGNPSASSNRNTDKEQSSTSATGQNVDALRGFRRLALVAVAAERFRAKAPIPTSENRQIAFPERKLSTKERLEELQRPTESYLRHYVVEETVPKTPSLKTSSKSLSRINSGITSASGVTNIRRVSQAAMATRILMDRRHRKTSGNGFSGLESQRQSNQGKTLAEMMNALKDCRYLRNSTMDDE